MHSKKNFAEPPNSDHGRLENRQIDVADVPFEYDEKWLHIKQIARITRTREIQGAVTKTTALLITSLTAAQASPERLLELNRNHWGIENRLHWVRDVVLGEDAAKSRQANAPQNLAALNGFVGHLLFKTFGKFTEGRTILPKTHIKSYSTIK